MEHLVPLKLYYDLMKKKKFIHTKFIEYLWEKYNNTPDPENEDDIDIPLPEDEEDLPTFKKNLRMKPMEVPFIEEEEDEEDNDEDEDEPITDEEILEKLIGKYKTHI